MYNRFKIYRDINYLTLGGENNHMEYIGILAFILALSNMGLSDKVKKLKADVAKINSSSSHGN